VSSCGGRAGWRRKWRHDGVLRRRCGENGGGGEEQQEEVQDKVQCRAEGEDAGVCREAGVEAAEERGG